MFEFKLPDLGEGVHEGQVVNVLVKEGDEIGEYQPMLEVETDKAAVEIPSPKSGVVAKVHVQPGQMVKVGQVLISIEEGGGDGRGKPATAEQPAERAAPKPAPAPELVESRRFAPIHPAPATAPHTAAPVREIVISPAARGSAAQTAVAAPAPSDRAVRDGEGPAPAAPAVRKLARDLGVDINRVPGTGPGGRIMCEDVEQFAAAGGREPAPMAAAHDGAAAGVAVPGAPLPDFSQYGSVQRLAVPQIRKTIARQMTRAWLNVPRVTHCDTADVTELERNRQHFNEGLKEGEPKLTMTAIVVKAVAAALRDFPVLNSSWDAASEEVIQKDYYHIGIAVDTPRGLVVPVLRDADRKSLPQIAAELSGLGERARAAKFEIAELRGATFTITNYGAVGGIFGTPMVNFPEVGILGLGRAKQAAVVRDGQIVARLILPLSLSFDHRIVDGADAARFTTEVIRSLENPLRLISL